MALRRWMAARRRRRRRGGRLDVLAHLLLFPLLRHLDQVLLPLERIFTALEVALFAGFALLLQEVTILFRRLLKASQLHLASRQFLLCNMMRVRMSVCVRVVNVCECECVCVCANIGETSINMDFYTVFGGTQLAYSK